MSIGQIKIIVRSIAGLLILIGLSSCIAWPVSKEGVIGTYQSVLEDGTPGLPDGGTEILELKADGTCHQVINLKDGRTFTAQGTWEWWPNNWYFADVMITKIYFTVDGYESINPLKESINPNLEKSLGYVQSHSVGRTLTGRIMLGSTEGSHYEKK